MTNEEKLAMLDRLDVWEAKVNEIFAARGGGFAIKEVLWPDDEGNPAPWPEPKSPAERVWTYPERRRRRWRKG